MTAIAAQKNHWPAISVIFARPRKQPAAPDRSGLQQRARRQLQHLPEYLLRDIGL